MIIVLMSSSYFTTTLSPYCMHKDISEPFHPFYLVPLLHVTALLQNDVIKYIFKKWKIMKIKGYHGHLSKKKLKTFC